MYFTVCSRHCTQKYAEKRRRLKNGLILQSFSSELGSPTGKGGSAKKEEIWRESRVSNSRNTQRQDCCEETKGLSVELKRTYMRQKSGRNKTYY